MTELATLRLRERGPIVLAAVEGEVDVSNTKRILDELTAAVGNSVHALLLDLTKLEFLDSSGVHMLYELSERLMTRQQRFVVVLPPGRPPRRAIELSGTDPAAWLYPDQPAALKALGEEY